LSAEPRARWVPKPQAEQRMLLVQPSGTLNAYSMACSTVIAGPRLSFFQRRLRLHESEAHLHFAVHRGHRCKVLLGVYSAVELAQAFALSVLV